MSEPLTAWLERQYRHAAAAILAGVSPVTIVKTRANFDQRIVPIAGAIVASPVPGDYDPDPDYFFHWFRDSALIVDALRRIQGDAALRIDTRSRFADFVRFSLSLRTLDGRRTVAAPGWRDRVAPPARRFLRSDQELSGVHGEAVASEARVNPDGTLDILDWPRPQHDGPALRALTLLRWADEMNFEPDLDTDVANLLHADLRYMLAHASKPCFDIWEEARGMHYYTECVSAAALQAGAAWLQKRDETDLSRICRDRCAELCTNLDEYWSEELGYYRSHRHPDGDPKKSLDIAVILAAIHAGMDTATHSVHDPKVRATLGRIERLFDAEYPINRHRPDDRGPALGRYAGDVYYAGGAYYFATLGAAEFCYRAATRAAQPRELITHGDALLETVRAFTPPDGAMAEQFDHRTGVPASARELGWSYAAFISCIHARRAAPAMRP